MCNIKNYNITLRSWYICLFNSFSYQITTGDACKVMIQVFWKTDDLIVGVSFSKNKQYGLNKHSDFVLGWTADSFIHFLASCCWWFHILYFFLNKPNDIMVICQLSCLLSCSKMALKWSDLICRDRLNIKRIQ